MVVNWWRDGWSMEIANTPWTEDTEREVAFVIESMSLSGEERILDLGCGYGRHSIALASKGYSVVGVDVTEVYIKSAEAAACELGISAEFICSDILDLEAQGEYDVVISLCDGGIGYFDSEKDNRKVFEIVSRSLVEDGQHLLQVLNKCHAEKYFPKRDWDLGKSAVSLVEFGWNPEDSRMQYSERLLYWGKTLEESQPILDASIRLYSLEELKAILRDVEMEVVSTSSSLTSQAEFCGEDLILVVQSRKTMC
jgi:SAM-dependent methyltransferase